MAASQEQAVRVPHTSYRLGSTLKIGDHEFVLTDNPDRLQYFLKAGSNLTVITSDHRGTMFLAPHNNMALGLLQVACSLDGKSVSPHYWIIGQEYELLAGPGGQQAAEAFFQAQLQHSLNAAAARHGGATQS
eukprot:GDKI01044790.1.p1 GENE.GDKI01044790.1~~GDKI01044790.1.p1  ORF type:complete len:132 (-),score=30.01 GDKI01044790.1:182-577(-)